eukprot:3902483-Rhodomonas_salina.2
MAQSLSFRFESCPQTGTILRSVTMTCYNFVDGLLQLATSGDRTAYSPMKRSNMAFLDPFIMSMACYSCVIHRNVWMFTESVTMKQNIVQKLRAWRTIPPIGTSGANIFQSFNGFLTWRTSLMSNVAPVV